MFICGVFWSTAANAQAPDQGSQAGSSTSAQASRSSQSQNVGAGSASVPSSGLEGRTDGSASQGSGQRNSGQRQMPRQRTAPQRPSSAQGATGRQRGTGSRDNRIQTIDPRRQFTENAMLFDFNNDQQLAAHELRNLFVLLVSQSQQQTAYRNTTPLSQRISNPSYKGSSANAGYLINTGTRGSGIPQGQAIRQAILIFLRLVMQFDANGDGLLSQAELNLFADALLNNNLSLVGAATNSRAYNRQNTGQNFSQQRYSAGNVGRNGLVPTTQQQQQQSILVLGQNGERQLRQGGQSRNRDRNYGRDVGDRNQSASTRQVSERQRIYGRDVSSISGSSGANRPPSRQDGSAASQR